MFENFRRFLETVFRAPFPPPGLLSLAPLSNRWPTTCLVHSVAVVGLMQCWIGLDGRGPPQLCDKPAAIKRKRRLLVAKAKPKAKPKLKAAPKPKPKVKANDTKNI